MLCTLWSHGEGSYRGNCIIWVLLHMCSVHNYNGLLTACIPDTMDCLCASLIAYNVIHVNDNHMQ